MSITYTELSENRTVELSLDGRVTRADFEALAPKFESFVEANGTVRVIEIIRSYAGFDASLLWDGLKLDLRVLPHISHCAVVGDMGWLSPVSKAAGAMLSTKLRTFPLSEIDAARRWIADPDQTGA